MIITYNLIMEKTTDVVNQKEHFYELLVNHIGLNNQIFIDPVHPTIDFQEFAKVRIFVSSCSFCLFLNSQGLIYFES